MCGRYAITSPPEAMRSLFGYAEQVGFPPRYNIAPTQPIPIVRADDRAGGERRHLTLARWAFLPSFCKDPKHFALIFNARSEGLGEKASFRNALRRRRCLVPADGFYEWQRLGVGGTSGRRPFLFRRADRKPMAFAGLWETWAGPNGEEVDTACIITTGAIRATSAIHPRLPAIIEPDAFDLWLDGGEASTEQASALLHPPADGTLEFFALGDAVNKVENDGPAVQEPWREGAQDVRPSQGSLF